MVWLVNLPFSKFPLGESETMKKKPDCLNTDTRVLVGNTSALVSNVNFLSRLRILCFWLCFRAREVSNKWFRFSSWKVDERERGS